MKAVTIILLGLVGGFGTLYFFSELYDFLTRYVLALNPSGNQLLEEESDLWVFGFIMLFAHLFAIAFSILLISRKLLQALGWTVLFFSVITGVFMSIKFSANKDEGPRVIEFNRDSWIQAEYKPIGMVRDVNRFIPCVTRDDMILYLGEPDTIPDSLLYSESDTLWQLGELDLHYLTDQKFGHYWYYYRMSFGRYLGGRLDSNNCGSRDLITFDPTD